MGESEKNGPAARAQALAAKVEDLNRSVVGLMLPREARDALAELAGLVADMAQRVEQLEGVCFGE